jgi:hypothetical protein
MSDSDAGTIMAKVHECKRKAHDLRDEAHTLTARAAIKGGPPVGGQVQDLVAEGAQPRERGQWPAVEIDCAVSQPRRADTRSGRPLRPPMVEPAAA